MPEFNLPVLEVPETRTNQVQPVPMSHINHGADLEEAGASNADRYKPRQLPPAPVIQENKFIQYGRPCIAEALQLTIFVFIGTMAGCTASGGIVQVALAHGLTIALLIMGFGGISGAHINPAVTLAVTLAGSLSPMMAIPYVISQLLGSVIGAGLCRGALGSAVYLAGFGGGQFPQGTFSDGECILAEIVTTMILVGSVLMTAVDTDGKSPTAPFAIGFTVLIDILAVGSVSGASMNPARSFGPAVILSLVEEKSIWDAHWIYWVGPACGALLAVGFYRLLFARPDKRLILKPKIA